MMKHRLWDNIPESVKCASPKKKWEYFWEYYKLHMIVAAFVLLFVGSLLYRGLTGKETWLNGFFLNSISQKTAIEALKDDFIESAAIDGEKYELHFDANMVYSLDLASADYSSQYETSQALVTQTAAKDLDFVIGDLPVMTVIAYSDYFLDLSTVLSAEEMEVYQKDLLYIDKAVLEELLSATSTEKEEGMIQIADCREPEGMMQPVPVMLDISVWETVKEIYGQTTEPMVLGCIVNSENVESVRKLINYLKGTVE